MTWSRKVAVILSSFLVVFLILYGCTADRPKADGSSGGNPTGDGEKCGTPGATRACHITVGVANGIKSCSVGQQTCTNERWGACTALPGQEIEISNTPTNAAPGNYSLNKTNLSGSGIHTLSHIDAATDAGCAPCDPDCEGWVDCKADASTAFDAGTDANAILGTTGPCPNPLVLIPPQNPNLITGFPGVPNGQVNKMLQDNNGGYNHGCSHWSHSPGAGTPTQPFSACQGDTNCTGNTCQQFAPDASHPASECLGAAGTDAGMPDLTIGNPCDLPAGTTWFPVCNRGYGTVPAGTVIGIVTGMNGNNLPQSTAKAFTDFNVLQTTPNPPKYYPGGANSDPVTGCPNYAANCYVTVGAGGLAPGQCQRSQCPLGGGVDSVYVNAIQTDGGTVAECDLNGDALYNGSPVAQGCSNNWTIIGNNSPICVTPIVPTSFDFSYTTACPPGSAAKWAKLSWNAILPPGTSIKFEARTQPQYLDGGLGGWTPYTQLALTPPDPAICPVTGVAGCPIDLGTALAAAAFGVNLELRILLTPAGSTISPTLNSWGLSYLCVDNE